VCQQQIALKKYVEKVVNSLLREYRICLFVEYVQRIQTHLKIRMLLHKNSLIKNTEKTFVNYSLQSTSLLSSHLFVYEEIPSKKD